ncbi:MAG: type II CAAX endopeptidase family protein [Acidobacteriia bacterium]|nr:type II CAAX endopeptidase family protein [Terriglobia bacterium]
MNFFTNASGDLRVGFRVLVFAFLSILTLLVVQLAVGWLGLDSGQPFQAVVYPLEATGVLGVSALCFRGLEQGSLSRLGLSRRSGFWVGLAGLVAGLLAVDLIFLAVIRHAGSKIQFSLHPEVFTSKEFLLALVVFFFAASLEELLFRGYPFLALQTLLRRGGAAALLSVLFVAFHPNLVPSPAAAPAIFLAGLFLTQLFVWSESLWLPVGFHFGWNLAQAVIFPLPGLQPTVVRLEGFDPAASGITLGVEQSWWAVGLLMALVILGELALLKKAPVLGAGRIRT